MKLFLIFLFYFVGFELTLAQNPKGIFIEDSIQIGKPVNFALIYSHNQKSDLVFPDSSYNFSPFKLVNISYFPTKTIENNSLDSVIYSLISFETDSILRLSLPISFLNSKKKLFSNRDSIKLKSSIYSNNYKTLPLKPSIYFYQVPLDFNFPKLLYYFIIILFISILIFLLFGSTILKQIKTLIYYRKNKEFVLSFKKQSKKINNTSSINNRLVIWKNHMEWLMKIPFSSMTTKEISQTLKNERLEDALKEFDTAIYGGQISDHIPFASNILLEIASETYKKEIKKYKKSLS
jgi:hypothetical protein